MSLCGASVIWTDVFCPFQIQVYYNMGHTFVILAINSICYDSTVLISEIWDHGNKAMMKVDRVRCERSGDQTSCKQADSLAGLSKPLYLEVETESECTQKVDNIPSLHRKILAHAQLQ